jgi:hypothetical protein
MLFSRKAITCDEPLGLYMRTQDIIVFVRELERIAFHSQDTFCPLRSRITCCVNLCDIVAPLMSKLLNGEGKLSAPISFPYTCCHTYAVILMRELKTKIMITVTKWINLGGGVNEDPSWQSHASTVGIYRARRDKFKRRTDN